MSFSRNVVDGFPRDGDQQGVAACDSEAHGAEARHGVHPLVTQVHVLGKRFDTRSTG